MVLWLSKEKKAYIYNDYIIVVGELYI